MIRPVYIITIITLASLVFLFWMLRLGPGIYDCKGGFQVERSGFSSNKFTIHSKGKSFKAKLDEKLILNYEAESSVLLPYKIENAGAEGFFLHFKTGEDKQSCFRKFNP